MSAADLAIVAALIFGWGTLSARLERLDVTAPIVFVLTGLLLTHGPLAVLGVAPTNELIKDLAEFTLALVLFSDASRVGLRELRADAGWYARLLGIALPVTIGLGTLLALAIPGTGIWLALLVGAALAPTDAALGAGMMVNPLVPARIRRLLNVESGLNDGIATPFVSVALAGAAAGVTWPATARPRPWPSWPWVFSSAPPLAPPAACWSRRPASADGPPTASPACGPGPGGVCLRVRGGGPRQRLHRRLRRGPGLRLGERPQRRTAGAVRRGGRRPGVAAGLAGLRRGGGRPGHQGPDLAGGLYALLSLTVVRVVPVAIALAGTRLGWPTVAWSAWFGPRGLASVVFALLALEELGSSAACGAVAVIVVTVLLSVVAHGVSAEPLAARYARSLARRPAADQADALLPDVPERRLIRHGSVPRGDPAG